jgi:Kef-type K+ transport system membrane component KefB
MVILCRIVCVIAVLICLGWVYSLPGWDSIAALIASVVSVVGSFVASPSPKSKLVQNQKVGRAGIAIQAGNDISIGKEK